MTFYEAALRVLEEAGKPLTHVEITQKSVEGNLLSHIGKRPELTMLARLAAMAKRPRDRKVQVTAKDTFALLDWMLPEDAEALALTGVIEPNPEEDLPPLRPIERHPEPKVENVRAVGRQGDRERRRHRDDEKRKKYPPMSEVAFEVLSDIAGGASPTDLLAKAREKELASDEFSVEQLLHALIDDNQRRIDAGRRPQFHYLEGSLKLDPGGEQSPADVQQAFCLAAGVPFENGRAVLRRPEPVVPPSAPVAAADLTALQTAKQAGRDARRAMSRILKQRISELDSGAFEKSIVRMMHALGFREVKVAKRSKDGPTLTARRREGSLELRYAVRLLKGSQQVERRTVQELRRDLGHYGANVGLLCAAGDVRGDARAEAVAGALIFLWCGEGLADQFLEAQVGVKRVHFIELFEVDEAFFELARKDAEEARQRREERHRERDDGKPEGDSAPSAPSAPRHVTAEIAAVAAPVAAAAPDDGEGEDGDDGEEGTAEAGADGAVPGGPSEAGKRRRRRRRGRRGRGPRTEGSPSAPGAPVAAGAPADGAAPAAEVATAAETSAAVAEAPTAPPPPAAAPAASPPSEPPASSGGGEGA